MELSQGRMDHAEDQWREAFAVSRQFDEADPRVGASMSNMGVAARLRGHREEAESLYRSALDRWSSARDWVREMHLQPRARSSLFHMRMEKKHRDAYDRIAVKPFVEVVVGGMGATRNNLAELLFLEGRLESSSEFLEQALEERSGLLAEEDPGAAVIRMNLSRLHGTEARDAARQTSDSSIGELFLSQARRQAWIVDNPPFFTDEGRLMSALLLVYVVPFSSLRGRVDGGAAQ